MDEIRELESVMWDVLSRKEALGQAWSRDGLNEWYITDWNFRFSAGNVINVTVTCGKQLWLLVWVAEGKGDGRSFKGYPKGMKLMWNKSARETAHNACAIIGLVVDAIERREDTV